MASSGGHTAGAELRRHPRVSIRSAVRAVQDDSTYEGRIKDISVGGAAVQMEGDLDDERMVELHIEDLARVTGQVARPLEDGFAFTFDPDEIDEEPFLDDIMRLHDGMQAEDY